MNLWEKIKNFFSDCYGLDGLGQFIWIVTMLWGMIGAFTKRPGIMAVAIIGTAYSIYRIFSRDYWDRKRENEVFAKYVKLLKLNFENRKYARIFLCRKCGRYIRVPKKKGRIEITCPNCGNKEIHKT